MAGAERGLAELDAARSGMRRLTATVILFGIGVNALALTGPLYMLQVYDRVLASRSEATLVALSILLVILFIAMGLLDAFRGRIMARIGARFQTRLDARVFDAALQRRTLAPDDPAAVQAGPDLAALRAWIASPVRLAAFDVVWTPVYLAALFLFHPLLGTVAVAGGAILVALAAANRQGTQAATRMMGEAVQAADRLGERLAAEAETLRGLGMARAGQARWQVARDAGLRGGLQVSDAGGAYSTASRTFRMFLQSAMLGTGAWLVLRGSLGAGAMFASSILLGRALLPVETVVAGWAVPQRAAQARTRLAALLQACPMPEARTALPRPKARLDVQALSVVPPGERSPTLRAITFALEPGQALGVIGPSGAGKSSLARALTGVWPAATGTIRLGGAALDHYGADGLGRLIGTVPQRVALFDGTVAENIARLDRDPDPAEVVRAAQRAGVHEMILSLPGGYDTRLTGTGGRLSGGQIQRVGLARALYGDPVLLVLDEPNASLDNDGALALNRAIRDMKAAGGAVIIMAHRPSAIQECELLLVLGHGTMRAYGPRDGVLRDIVRTHTALVPDPLPVAS